MQPLKMFIAMRQCFGSTLGKNLSFEDIKRKEGLKSYLIRFQLFKYHFTWENLQASHTSSTTFVAVFQTEKYFTFMLVS